MTSLAPSLVARERDNLSENRHGDVRRWLARDEPAKVIDALVEAGLGDSADSEGICLTAVVVAHDRLRSSRAHRRLRYLLNACGGCCVPGPWADGSAESGSFAGPRPG